jgi:hypothetical protein
MSDDQVTIKQYPYDLKAEATAQGYRIHCHVYGESVDGVVTDLARMIRMAINEFEFKGLPLVANAPKVVVTK